MSRPSGIVVTATLGLLSLIWGTTWAAIRIGLRGVPPFTGVALRFGIAAVVLFALARLQRVPLGRTRTERRLWIVNGLLSFCVSYGIVYWAEQWVPSGLTAVLWATFPLFVAVLAHFALPDEPLRAGPAAGILVGFAGVALIFSEDFAKLGGPGVAFASGVLLVSPLVSAFANVAIKRWGKGLHHLSLTVAPMAITAVVMGAVAAGVERDRPIAWSGASVGALLYLALAGSALTFSLYYWLLQHLPATRVSLIAYTTPVVAVTVGAVFMDEPYTLRTLAGSALVLGGVGLSAKPFRRARRPAVVAIAVFSLASRAVAVEPRPLRIPSDPAPAAVRAMGSLEGLSALALTEDGATAAAALEVVEKGKRRSILRVANGQVRETTVDGVVRELRFGPGGDGLYALVARVHEKKGTDASVVRYDPATLRAGRSVRVPPTASAMDLSADGAALLVASRDELRVLLVPELQSPRLFGVAGNNSAIAVVPGTDLALVAQGDALVLVSLADRQGRDGLPVRERVAIEVAIVSLVAASDGSGALGRASDGRTLHVTLDPLGVEDFGVSTAVAWIGARVPYTPSIPEPVEIPAPVAEKIPPPEPASALPIPPPEPEAVPPPPLERQAPPAPEPIAPEPASPEPASTIRGRIAGPARSEVSAVVLYGPDSLLREAARVAPAPDGSWSAGPLPAGSYRVVLDAGGSRTVVSEPPFARVVVPEGAGAVAPELTVVRVMRP